MGHWTGLLLACLCVLACAGTPNDLALTARATAINRQAVMRFEAGEYAKAAALARSALQLRERVLPPGHPQLSESLDNAGLAHKQSNDPQAAKGYYLRAVASREHARPLDPAALAASLGGLADVLRALSDHAAAEQALRRAIALCERLPANHPTRADSSAKLAWLHHTRGDIERAQAEYLHASQLLDAIDPTSLEAAINAENWAGLHRARGDFEGALPLYQRALQIKIARAGLEHPLTAIAFNNIGVLHLDRGDYGRAEQSLLWAQQIVETRKADPVLDADVLTNLAHLYRLRGEPQRAEPLLLRAIAVYEPRLAQQPARVAAALNHLGALHEERGDHQRAADAFRRSLAIWSQIPGQLAEIPEVTSNLAHALYGLGDRSGAQQHHERALRLLRAAKGPTHPSVGLSLNNLAAIYAESGDPARARSTLDQALRIVEGAYGPEHPDVALCLANQAAVRQRLGDHAGAVRAHARAAEIDERWLTAGLAYAAEPQRRAYAATLRARTDAIVDLHVRAAPELLAAAELAFTTIVRRKGRVLDALRDSWGKLRASASAEEQKQIDALRALRTALANLVLSGLPPGSSVAARETGRAQLTERIRLLEEQLYLRFAAELDPRSTTPTSLTQMQAALGPGTALVEIALYERSSDRAGSQPAPRQQHYVAYVLRPDGPLRFVELGVAAQLDASVAALRGAVVSRDDSYRPLARELGSELLAKIEPLLGDARDLLIAPDGALNLLPFGILLDARQRFAIERYRFTYLSSGHDRLRVQPKAPPRQLAAAVIVAHPDFGPVPTNAPPNAAPALAELARAVFTPLPQTAREAELLHALLPEAALWTGAAASERALRELRAPKLLHIATHGFFLGAAAAQAPAAPATRGIRFVSNLESADPLLRSGLALAGANQRSSGEDDGILSALEAASLDLWGTQLVVLSACQSGVGEVYDGEGVYGLRSAFALAGAEAQVMTLWPIDDPAAPPLMQSYYTRLLAGGGRSDALREAQLAALRDRASAHPRGWAAFIAAGDGRSLQGAEPPPVRIVH